MWQFYFVLLLWLSLGLVGRWIGKPKGRAVSGFWFGLFLGPFGWVITILMDKTPDAIALEEQRVRDAQQAVKEREEQERRERETLEAAKKVAAEAARAAQLARETEAWTDFSADPRLISREGIDAVMTKLRARHNQLRDELLRRDAVHKAQAELRAAEATDNGVALKPEPRVPEPKPIVPPALEALLDAMANDPEAFPNGKPVSATAKKKA